MKKILLLAGVLALLVVTVPLWGGCDLEYKVKSVWCDIRHFNSDTAALSCKARAVATKAGCLAEQGLDSPGIKL